MNKKPTALLVPLIAFASCFLPAQAETGKSFYEAVKIQEILGKPDIAIDLATAKLTIDKLVAPTIDIESNRKRIGQVVLDIKSMLKPSASSSEKMLAIKKYLYEKGEWNQHQAYQYDFDDPLGTKISNKLLPNYMKSKKGNSITMPFLFIILGERMNINVTAAVAPLHVLVKFTDEKGAKYNLETTSGANIARHSWYRQQMPMTDQAVKNGLYLQPLTKKETVAVMATVLAKDYFEKGEFEKAIAISNITLNYYPKYDNAMLRKGSAYFRLLQNRFLNKYPNPRAIPINQRQDFQYLSQNNRIWFAKAEALGWREPKSDFDAQYLQRVRQDAQPNQ